MQIKEFEVQKSVLSDVNSNVDSQHLSICKYKLKRIIKDRILMT